MQKDIYNFQSYLILGSSGKRQEQLAVLFHNLNFKASISSPDFFIIENSKISTSGKQSGISIDEIRNLKKHIFQKPVSAPFKIVIIKDAHNLTPEAQNAILKILEEPPSHAVIILEAENEFQLLPTILSRVVKIKSAPEILKAEESSFIERSVLNNLLNLQKIEKPLSFLDSQIIVLHKKLLRSVETGDFKTQKKIQFAIGLCLNAKKMIGANINPKFVFANLFLSFQKQP